MTGGGVRPFALQPEKRIYNASEMTMTEAAIDSTPTRDLYVSLGQPLGDGAWSVSVYHKPFVGWIWAGAVLAVVGGVLTLAGRRQGAAASLAGPLLVAWLGAGTALSPDAAAREAQPLAEDPALEARMVRLAEELRCVVCQNESLASSRADLAEDLRREVRDLLRAGRTDREVIEFLTERYGDFVLYRPPVRPDTWLLWFGPGLIAAAAAGGLFLYLRRTAAAVPADDGAPRAPADHHRAPDPESRPS